MITRFDIRRTEIENVNTHLDSLNSALDAIEQRNDDIHAQLLELLSSNREIRQSLHAEATASRPNKDGADRQPPSSEDVENVLGEMKVE